MPNICVDTLRQCEEICIYPGDDEKQELLNQQESLPDARGVSWHSGYQPIFD